MQDRVSLNPGRVLVTPEDGSSSFYATLTRADNPTQEGDPLNKNTLMKDATAALFGLGNNALPDDVLAYLGKYAQHWWKRDKKVAVYEPSLASSNTTLYMYYGGYENTRVVQASTSVSVNQVTGVLELNNPQNVTIQYTGDSCKNLNGYYIKNLYGDPSNIYYMSSNTVSKAGVSGDNYYVQSAYMKLVSVATSEAYLGNYEYMRSSDRNAYPDSGELDGYTYVYLGVPFDNGIDSPKISTGSYTGTGTYDSSNPNSLTFDFIPKMIFVTNKNRTVTDYGFMTIPVFRLSGEYDTKGGYFVNDSSVYTYYAKVDEIAKKVYWYSTSANAQFNTSGNTFEYFAIG